LWNFIHGLHLFIIHSPYIKHFICFKLKIIMELHKWWIAYYLGWLCTNFLKNWNCWKFSNIYMLAMPKIWMMFSSIIVSLFSIMANSIFFLNYCQT
jgi:hypothetical protein